MQNVCLSLEGGKAQKRQGEKRDEFREGRCREKKLHEILRGRGGGFPGRDAERKRMEGGRSEKSGVQRICSKSSFQWKLQDGINTDVVISAR